MERWKKVPAEWLLVVAMTLAFLFIGTVLVGCSDDCNPTAPVVQEREDDDRDDDRDDGQDSLASAVTGVN